MRLHTSTRKNFGFALVATVSMMVLLTLVAIAMLSLSTIEQRSSGGGANEADRMARANARMALMMALGELQKAAGPDQRVTATASILGNANNTGWSMNGTTKEYFKDTSAVNGKKHWVGIWDSTNYSPADPDNKPFLRWLVSGDQDELSEIAEVGRAVDSDPVTGDFLIFEGLAGNGNPDPNGGASIKVPKVEVATATPGNTSYYAYWVEDEGVKTDLKWEEIEAASTSDDDKERAQARRLSAIAGPNYWVTAGGGRKGPFADPNDDASTTDAVATSIGIDTDFPFDQMQKVTSLENVSLATGSVQGDLSAHKKWLKAIRHTVSVNNRGVLADVKKGGLRRDLTLAFEMDGDDDISASEQPSLFNQQVGEFVGGSDKYGSVHDYPVASGLPRARHLFRERWDTAGPFSNTTYFKRTDSNDPTWAYSRNPSVARGPTWWNLRDYYNLYKRMEKSGANYRIKARAYYPDRTTIGYAHSDMLDTISTWADHRDTDYRAPLQGPFKDQWKYIFRPARPSYAPVFLGTTTLYSIIATNYDAATQTADVAITLDPIFYLWNPYNRELEVDNVMAHFETGMSGTIGINITDNASAITTNYVCNTWKLLNCNLTNYQETQWKAWGMSYGFIVNGSPTSDSFTLQPGEVVAASPSANTGQSYLGYDPLNNSSGIFMTSIDIEGYRYPWDNPNNWNGINWRQRQVRVSVAPGATSVNVGYYDAAGGGMNTGRFFIDTSLGPDTVTAATLASQNEVPGNQTQHTHMQLTSKRYEYAIDDTQVFDAPIDLNTLLNVKQQFGLFTYLMKPANWSGKGANSVEIFSRFNPAPLVVNKDFWAAATPNMVFNFVSDQAPNNLINSNGLNFSTSTRSAFWGRSYDSSGQTTVTMSNIPSSPLLSIVDFGHANLGTMAEDPFHSVGNSLPSSVISPIAPYGVVNTAGGVQTNGTGIDLSWLLNDALFDRYFLSGIVPEYTITTSGFNQTGSLGESLNDFYGVTGSDFKSAQASPLLEPYVPTGKTAEGVVAELLETDLNEATNATPGYKKMAAYSMLKGGFNINSPSATTWARFIRGSNGDMDVKFTDGTTDSRTGHFGFPRSNSPSPSVGSSQTYQSWFGWSRLYGGGTSGDLWGTTGLITHIPTQVMERAPFMSVSDFVNRKVSGDTNGDGSINNLDITPHHKGGAVQAAVDKMRIKTGSTTVYQLAGGVATDYGKHSPMVPSTTESSNTARGVPGDVTQADVLRAITPRLTARSDTFRIRGYGEVRDADDKIIASAMCEAVVQRLPEYVDTETDPTNNEPWDEGDTLNATNDLYGRRFEIQNFRWLDESEV